MNIDVKQNDKGYWFYSFGIEKGTAPQTLLAVVTDESATVLIDIISKNSENVKTDKDNSYIPQMNIGEDIDSEYMTAVENGVKNMYTGDKTAKIQVGMSDSERTEILKNKSLTVVHYQGQADEVIKDNKVSLESKKISIVQKALKKVADSFGNYGDYNVKDFDVEVSYSNNSVKESAAKVTDKKVLAKLFPIHFNYNTLLITIPNFMFF